MLINNWQDAIHYVYPLTRSVDKYAKNPFEISVVNCNERKSFFYTIKNTKTGRMFASDEVPMYKHYNKYGEIVKDFLRFINL